MYSHVTVGVSDLSRAMAFYRPLMEALNLALKFSDGQWAGWKSSVADRPLFIIMRPFDRQPPAAGNGQMVAFQASCRAIVERCHAIALAGGGHDEGGPGLRPHYHAHYYGAYFRDPDVNKLCVCCHALEQP